MKKNITLLILSVIAVTAISQTPYDRTKGFLYCHGKMIGCITDRYDTIIDPGLIPRDAYKQGLLLVTTDEYPADSFYMNTTLRLVTTIRFYSNGIPYNGVALASFLDTLCIIRATGEIQKLQVFDSWTAFENGISVVGKAGLYACMDTEGRMLTDFIYEEIKEFNEGLAPVKKNKLWGYIDTSGQVIIEPVYYEAFVFSDGLGLVMNEDGEYVYIDSEGKILLGPYETAQPFSEGLAYILHPKKGYVFINKKGKVAFPAKEPGEVTYTKFSSGLMPVYNGRWGCMDKNVNIVIDFQFTEPPVFMGDLALVYDYNRYAVIDRTGRFVLNYTEKDWFYDSYYKDIDLSGTEYLPVSGENGIDLIEMNGNPVNEYPISYIWTTHDGVSQAGIKINDTTHAYAVIGKNGKTVSGVCESVGYYNGRFAWIKKEGKYAMIDGTGSIISDWFDEVCTDYRYSGWELTGIMQFYSEETIPVRKGDKWGFCTMEGKTLFEPQFDKVFSFSHGSALVFRDGKPLLADKNGGFIEPEVDDIRAYSKYRYAALKGDKWGFIDGTGKTVSDFIHDMILPEISGGYYSSNEAVGFTGFLIDNGVITLADELGGKMNIPMTDKYQFYDGTQIIETGSGSLMIDSTGTILTQGMYDFAGFSEDEYKRIRKNEKWGYLGKNGKEIIPCKYEAVGGYGEGLFAMGIQTEDGIKWGFLDNTGKTVISFQYAQALPFSEGLAAFCDDKGKWGYLDKTGKVVINPIFYDAKPFSEGLAAVKSFTGWWEYINKKGYRAFDGKFGVAGAFSEGRAYVCGKYYGGFYIDKTGKCVVDCDNQ